MTFAAGTTMAASTTLASADNPTLASFGHDTWWLVLGKVVAIFGFLVVMTLFLIWAERRVVARMQQRLGPNRVGPFGLGQSLMDGLKLALKEDLIPFMVDKPVYLIAPILSTVPAFMAFAVLPLGGEVSIFGHRTALQITDLPVAVLYVLACSSLGVYGLVLAGWASGSTYPLLGGLRSAAQVISYEVCLALSLVPVFLYAGSLSTSEIVTSQNRFWYVLPLAPSFVIYIVSAVGETNRAPFDLPEAEGELVGGFHTEYSSLKFALFFLAEYINMTTVSAVATTLFFGGWHAPFFLSRFGVFDNGWFGVIWFTSKTLAILFTFIWLRGTLPRLRYDQFMQLAWKRLIPVSLLWLLFAAAARVASIENLTRSQRYLYGGSALVLVLIASAFWPQKAEPAPTEADRIGIAVGNRAFPVPALPGEDPLTAVPATREVPSA